MKEIKLPKQSVRYITVEANEAGRRVDNFLLAKLKGLPRRRLYRIIRKGEIRINGSRVKAVYRVQAGDEIRIPPLYLGAETAAVKPRPFNIDWLNAHILYEDEDVIVLNKPAGIAVHGGSGVSFNIIGALRCLRNDGNYLELAHRLDRATSGCLIIAKHYRSLSELHTLLANQQVSKHYTALVKGQWEAKGAIKQQVIAPLHKSCLRSGEWQVEVDEIRGKPACTVFALVTQFSDAALLDVDLKTGRTHQIRVHACALGQPVGGDTKYGDAAFNKSLRNYGLKRLFLHARSVSFTLPSTKRSIHVEAPLDKQLMRCLERLDGSLE